MARSGAAAAPIPVERIDDFRWRIPRQGAMRVDGLVYADDALMKLLRGEEALRQVANVATLPGIVGHSIGMPDIHWGYGFAIGGVAATRVRDGVVSPGGVGFDINCGVRLLRTPLRQQDVMPKLKQLLDQLFRDVPAGAGRESDRPLSRDDEEKVLRHGAAGAVRLGYGFEDDLAMLESGGALPG